MRPIYRRRRDRLLEALADHLPDLRPTGVSAGLHVLAWLPADLDEPRIVAAALEAGIGIAGLTSLRFTPGPGGLILGYGGIVEHAIDDGIRALANVIAAVADKDTTIVSNLPGH
jgi:GntR family transcriptional regulator/MocR family aminotransferase